MAATIPGFLDYSVDAVSTSASTNVVALTVPASWTAAKGAVAFLSLTVQTDGDWAMIRSATSSSTDKTDDPIVSAELDTANSVARTARFGPIPRSAVTGLEIYTSGASTGVIYKWLPVTEWGN